MGRKARGSCSQGESKKKVFRPRIFDHDSLEEPDLEKQAPRQQIEPKPKLRQRITRRFGGWMKRRLQKRVEREWRDYKQPPEVSVGPLFSRKRLSRGDTQVYRSMVQIHFHPRAREPR